MLNKIVKWFNPDKKPTNTVVFFMRGGHQVVVPNVTTITMKTDYQTDRFSSYSIVWEEGCKPSFFSLVIDDIIAVVATKD